MSRKSKLYKRKHKFTAKQQKFNAKVNWQEAERKRKDSEYLSYDDQQEADLINQKVRD